MTPTLTRTQAVTFRVWQQLRHDRRFLALSLAVPVIVIYLLKVFFDSAENPMFDPTSFVVPMGAFIVHFITYILAAIVLVRERTTDTLSRMFVSGYRQADIILGYVAAYTLLGTVQSLLVMVGLQLAFNLDYPLGTFAEVFVVIWLLAVISIALGIFVSNFARNEGQVFPFIPLLVIPSAFLSGIIVPVTRLPDWIEWTSQFLPLYHANEVIQVLIEPNGGLLDQANNLLALPVYGMLVLLLATLTLREID
jgi:ABC-2 type transport system permease protein